MRRWSSDEKCRGTSSEKYITSEDIIGEDGNKGKSFSGGKTIRYCVLYLAPKDYHRFHAPVDFELQTGRHFPGEVLPVNPWL